MKKMIYVTFLIAIFTLLYAFDVYAQPQIHYANGSTIFVINDNVLYATSSFRETNRFEEIDRDVADVFYTAVGDNFFVLKTDGSLYYASIYPEYSCRLIDTDIKMVNNKPWLCIIYTKTDGSLWMISVPSEEKEKILDCADSFKCVEITDNGMFYGLNDKNEVYIWGDISYYFDVPYNSPSVAEPMKILDNVKDCEIGITKSGTPFVIYLTADGKLCTLGIADDGAFEGTAKCDCGRFSLPIENADILTENVKEFYKSVRYICYLKNDSTLWHIGINCNDMRETGDAEAFYFTPMQIADDVKQYAYSFDENIILKNNGTVIRYYRRSLTDSAARVGISPASLEKFEGLNNITEIPGALHGALKTCGYYLLDSENTVWGIGVNCDGILGLEDKTPQSIRIYDNPVECRFLTELYDSSADNKTPATESADTVPVNSTPPQSLYTILSVVLGVFAVIYVYLIIKK